MGSLTNLIHLYLANNDLSGDIPTQLGSLSNLTHLYLNGNQLGGCIPGDLHNTANHDLNKVGLLFCGKLLSGLTISPGPLIPSFDPYRTNYSVAVGLSRITIVPGDGHYVSIQIVDESGSAIDDADGDLEGYQVDFNFNIPAIKIVVVTEDSSATITYTITDLGIRYDANENGLIGKSEAISAVIDYFGGLISREEAVAVINLYLSN